MRMDERRRFPRLKVPVFYRDARLLGPRSPARDLSLGGVRIRTDDALNIGKRLEVELFLPDGGSLSVDVRVAWVRPLNDDFAKFEAGLEFLAMDPDQAKLVERCVMDVPSE